MVYYLMAIVNLGIGILGIILKRDLMAKLIGISISIQSLVFLLLLLAKDGIHGESQIQALFVLVVMILEIMAGAIIIYSLLKTKSLPSLNEVGDS